MEKHTEACNMVFNDLEKSYVRVTREVMWLGLEKKGVPLEHIKLEL